jgi:hypothetical protein
MRFRTVVAYVPILLACGSSGPPPRSADDIAAEYRGRLEKLRERTATELWWPVCEVPARIGKGCGLLFNEMTAPARFDVHVERECLSAGIERSSDACTERLRRRYFAGIQERYSRASTEDIKAKCRDQPADCDALWKVELLFIASHNGAVWAEETASAEKLLAEHARTQAGSAESPRGAGAKGRRGAARLGRRCRWPAGHGRGHAARHVVG